MAEDEVEKTPRDIRKILTYAFMALNVAVLSAGAFLVYSSTLGVKPKSTSNLEAEREIASLEEKLRGAPVLFKMEPFTTNLDGVPRRLVRMDISLEMMDEEGYEEVIGINPQARDSIMRILNGKSFLDVESVQGKLHLKNQIISELNGALKKGVVKNVYFNDLVVQ